MTTTTNLPLLLDKINILEIEQRNLHLPALASLEASIQYHAARIHSIDPKTAADHKDALQSALEAKRIAENSWERNGQIVRELNLLRQEVQHAEHEERQHKANAANRDLESASADYLSSAKQLVRAYRRCMNVSTRNQGIPGASASLPPGPHLPLKGFWSGQENFSTAQEMTFGLLPVEREEKL